MKISEIKQILANTQTLEFGLEAGNYVPAHFHVTEIGLLTKHFIDCGGVERLEKLASFQLWHDNDTEHRLEPSKLLYIIGMAEKIVDIQDLEIEIEYQAQTIGKYSLGHDGKTFVLIAKKTACLALDSCGIEPLSPLQQKAAIQNTTLTGLQTDASCCSPSGGCC